MEIYFQKLKQLRCLHFAPILNNTTKIVQTSNFPKYCLNFYIRIMCQDFALNLATGVLLC